MADETEKSEPVTGAEARAILDAWREEEEEAYTKLRTDSLAAGKEPFDLDVFYATYIMATAFPDPPGDGAAAAWERRYFESRASMTVKSFAEFMNLNDVYDGG